eukprot:TRINITY_DN5144_c0_g1_i1.p1 TRINITY_DN5144_c0_g1~~TRINITY_DN5144_c0_g1_i1.p1  ORF type:complete len:412 (-),score=49.66 TRINITY_DN5144_c0_g1_i1:73-1308(-)
MPLSMAVAPAQSGDQAAGAMEPRGQIYEVWAWNFEAELSQFLNAVSRPDVVLGLDTEFPGFLVQEFHLTRRDRRYVALKDNVDKLRPIQIGIAVSQGEECKPIGTWCFNLQFDLEKEAHTQESVSFLRRAGVDFSRHASQGIDQEVFGRKLATSSLFSLTGTRPQWVTFHGDYDYGYLMKLLTRWPLPQDAEAFDQLLDAYCPQRRDLRYMLPRGSLDHHLRSHEVKRHGVPHTAGSDAQATLELFGTMQAGNKSTSSDTASTRATSSPSPPPTPNEKAEKDLAATTLEVGPLLFTTPPLLVQAARPLLQTPPPMSASNVPTSYSGWFSGNAYGYPHSHAARAASQSYAASASSQASNYPYCQSWPGDPSAISSWAAHQAAAATAAAHAAALAAAWEYQRAWPTSQATTWQ